MRTLLLLRGAPGAGKSTWIEENNLQNYTLEADKFRQLTSNPILGKDGRLQIESDFFSSKELVKEFNDMADLMRHIRQLPPTKVGGL